MEEYEFSDDEDFMAFETLRFGCKFPENKNHDYNFIAFFDNGCSVDFKYCRKINTEKKEAITKIKELVEKYNIDKKEIYGS